MRLLRFSRRHVTAGVAILLIAFSPCVSITSAQRPTVVRGRVRDAGTNRPLAGALVELLDSSLAVPDAVSELSTSRGEFLLRARSRPTSVRATVLGYAPGVTPLPSISASDTVDVELALHPLGMQLDPVVVTVSRSQERSSAAPATVTVIDATHVEEQPTTTPVEHARDAPGVDIATTGIIQSHIVTRGFNGVFSGALLVLTDYRFDLVPSLRVNTPWLIPTTSADIDHIEVVLGPAAALYGPNAASGVLQIFTKSPFDSPGTTVSAGAISRSGNATGAAGGGGMMSLRHAATLGTRFGYKLTAQYLAGTDWRERDSTEANARRSLIASGFDSTRILVGRRDFDVSRWSGEGEVEFRPTEGSEIVVNAGRTHAGRAIDLTGIGAAQVRDWSLDHFQARVRRGELFAQAFLTVNDAGSTYLLRSGNAIVDRSRMLVAQVQNATDVGTRETFTYGVDAQRTDPRTGGTIDGRFEDDDTINEIGGYLQSETHLAPRLDAILSARVDRNNRLPSAVFSPRAAIVFRPADEHVVRLTFNRAFETPTSQNLFSDLPVLVGAGGLPFNVRLVGVPATGFSFARSCGGASGLCMRSPFVGAQMTPIDATAAWAGVVQLAKAAGWGDLSGVPAPTSAQVGSVLRVANIGAASPSFSTIDANAVTDVPALRPTVTNTLEVGYKGQLGEHFRVALDVYSEWRKDFIGPAQVITPSVFLDATSLAAYLTSYLSPSDAARVATLIAGVSESAATPGLPLGTVAPTGPLGGSSDVLVTYRNFGALHRLGSDVGAQWNVFDGVSLTGAYSWTNKLLWSGSELGGISGIALNAPGNRFSLAVQRRDASRGYSAYARIRHAGAFPMNSGAYVGPVAAYTIADAGGAYRIPHRPDLLLTISADNVFNAVHREFVGAPEVGRLVIVQLAYTLR